MTPLFVGTLPRLFVVQFLSWSAMFCLWIHGLPLIAAILGGGVEAAIPTVGLCFSGYALLASLFSFAHPWLFARVPAALVHAAGLSIGAFGMALLAMASQGWALIPAFVALAVCWSTMGSVPYAAAAAAALPGKGANTLRTFGLSTVLPQAATTLILASLAGSAAVSSATVILIGAAELAIAGFLTFLWRRRFVVADQDW